MKKLVLILLSMSYLVLASAQDCDPNQIYADSSNGVYPLPFDSLASPDGGITNCAIIGQPYEFVFTIVVGDSLTFGGSTYSLDSIRVTGVQGLPVGLNYACNPTTTCSFPSNTLNCAVIYGTPTAANTPGTDSLTITGEAFIAGSSFPFPLTFPDPDLLPGVYALTLLPDDTAPCGTVNATQSLDGKVSITTRPNPSAGLVQIEVFSKLSGKFNFKVVDLPGQPVYNSTVELTEGRNQFDFDGSQLSNGMYILLLESEQGSLSQKLLIQH
jgi:type IX secretion system substrate protein